MPNLDPVVFLSPSSIGSAIEVTVASLASPTELNGLAASQGDLVITRTVAAGTDDCVIYYADTTSDAEALPYIVSSSTSGVKFVAIAGRYRNGTQAISALTASRIITTDANKNLETPATVTTSQAVALNGTTTVVDGSFSIVGSGDATKTIKFEVDAQTAADDLTINSGAQTDDRTLTVPVLTGNSYIVASTATLTSGRVPYSTTGGILTDSATLQWDGTNFIVGTGADSQFILLDGATSGATGGAFIGVRNGGVTSIAFGNKSAVVGGGYNATPYFYGSSTVESNVGFSIPTLALTTGTGTTLTISSTANSSTLASNSVFLAGGLGVTSDITVGGFLRTNTDTRVYNGASLTLWGKSSGSNGAIDAASGSLLLQSGSSTRLTITSSLTTSVNPIVVTLGAVTVSSPFFSGTQEWNSGGTTFAAFSCSVTDTASAAGSLLMDFQLGGSTKCSIAKDGLIATASTTLHRTLVALTDGAAAQVGTLNNSPTAGNPTKWVPINDNGTTRYIPAW